MPTPAAWSRRWERGACGAEEPAPGGGAERRRPGSPGPSRRGGRRWCCGSWFACYSLPSRPGTPPGALKHALLVLGEPGHQRPEPGADLLDLLVVLGLAALEEVRLAGVELLDQLAGERTVLDLAQDAAHLLAGLLVDQPRAAGVAAVLGGVRHRPVHLGDAALVHQVDDQLHLVQALEVGRLGLVTRLDQGVEARLDQLGQAAAEHSLLAEQVGLGLLGEGT